MIQCMPIDLLFLQLVNFKSFSLLLLNIPCYCYSLTSNTLPLAGVFVMAYLKCCCYNITMMFLLHTIHPPVLLPIWATVKALLEVTGLYS